MMNKSSFFQRQNGEENMQKIKDIIEHCKKETSCEIDVRYNEPMKEHTTFKIGGPADCWIQPQGDNFARLCASLLNRAKKEKIPVFILGGGANIVVSDKGIRGIVLDMGAWKSCGIFESEDFILKSGTTIDEACEIAAAAGLSGFEFLAGMPGTIGGALWMNARCYDSEMSDILNWVEIIFNDQNEDGEYKIKRLEIGESSTVNLSGFGYKKSPFQEMDCLILNAAFKQKKSEREEIKIKMEKNRQDRKEKGHYLYPCAGSVFKNNRDFGKPTGLIIDELGLKGLQIGGAKVAPFHGNIIINTGNATASDIRSLVDEITVRVKTTVGFALEPEVLFIGEW